MISQDYHYLPKVMLEIDLHVYISYAQEILCKYRSYIHKNRMISSIELDNQ